jgi:hypothetical protein
VSLRKFRHGRRTGGAALAGGYVVHGRKSVDHIYKVKEGVI